MRHGRMLLLALWLGAAPLASAVTGGQSLTAALEELRTAGLRLIFSSALIEPGYVVQGDPGTGPPEEVARRILAPYGLTLDSIRPGFFAVVKHRDPAAANGDASRPSSGGVPSRPAAIAPVPEVNIYASRYKIEGQKSEAPAQLTREDLDVLPGLDEDVMRVTRFLPGTASNSLSARAHVRGGREDELAVYFDGVPLYEPFHFKDVQALLGILDPQSISTVDFSSGVFPVRYGNRLSGVLDIEPRHWDGETHNILGVNFLYSQALSTGRLESAPVEWLASVRRGNMDLIARALERDTIHPDFVDALGRVQMDLGGRSTLALGGLSLDDTLDVALRGEAARIDYRDTTGWLTWQLQPREDGRQLRAVFSHTDRHTERQGSVNQVGSAMGSVDDDRYFDTTTLRLEGAAPLARRLQLTGGLEAFDYRADYDYVSAASFDPLLARAFDRSVSVARAQALSVDGEAYAGYASLLADIADRLRLDLGLRWDREYYGRAFDAQQLSPRLSLQFQADPKTLLRLNLGRLAQAQRPDELAVQDGDETFHPAQMAQEAVFSLERRASPHWLYRFEAFDKKIRHPTPSYENLLDPFVLLPELAIDRVSIRPQRSLARGAELSVRWTLPPGWQGWLSYSRSTVRDTITGASVPRSWDQKHALTAGLNWTRGQWSASGNAGWHSGWPSNRLLLTSPQSLELLPLNSRSWPDYFSLDLRGVWSHALRGGGLKVFVEALNATNRDNFCCSDYRVSAAPVALSREVSGWLPRLYQLGVSWELP